MIHYDDLRTLVVRPTLQYLGQYSVAAENLIIGTIAVESTVGNTTRLRQITGPALGILQIEPDTHADTWRNWLQFRPDLRARVLSLCPTHFVQADGVPEHSALIGNLPYSVAIARQVYMRRPDKLPDPNDVRGLGEYWKRWYNSHLGAGTVEKFMQAYPR
jgi:hypothetical protein